MLKPLIVIGPLFPRALAVISDVSEIKTRFSSFHLLCSVIANRSCLDGMDFGCLNP